MTAPAVAVVVVTYESAGTVGSTLAAIASQLADGDELVVVDNASTDGTARVAREAAPGARVLEQSGNLGFAGGCHVGARASTAALLLFLNPDTRPAPGFLDALREVAGGRPGWGAWQALVTLPGGDRINTTGGVAHFLGLGWAGRCGEPVESAPAAPEEVPFASGAAMVVRREAWERLGGFDERYFMYVEDVDLSLRMWLSGWGVGVVPSARAEHDYDFVKGARKWFLLERNRWWTVLSVYPRELLVLLAPALLLSELALIGVAASGGWLPSKLRAQAAVARELPQILERRRQVQAQRRASAAAFAAHLSAALDSPYLGGLARVPPLAAAQRAYWRAVGAVLALVTRS
jgi:GT2 family glycosyltransferase